MKLLLAAAAVVTALLAAPAIADGIDREIAAPDNFAYPYNAPYF